MYHPVTLSSNFMQSKDSVLIVSVCVCMCLSFESEPGGAAPGFFR